jgi:hypothetical protein
MKNFAKLCLFFSLSFVIIFLSATGIRFLALLVDWARTLPPKPETFLTLVITAAHWALSLAMYSSILLSLGYAARRECFAIMTVITVVVLSLFFNIALTFALHNWQFVPPAQTAGIQMGGNGLILSNSLNRNETAVVLLKGTAQPLGPRVSAMPDRPLAFHESVPQSAAAGRAFDLPPVPFGDNTPWFLRSISIDIRLSEEQLQKRFDDGVLSYLIYVGSLIFLLTSLGFAMKFSVWPLANLFIGALVFRGILAIETFFNSAEMQDIFGSFFRNMLPTTMAVPLIFFCFGLLVHGYSFLVYASKRRAGDEY